MSGLFISSNELLLFMFSNICSVGVTSQLRRKQVNLLRKFPLNFYLLLYFRNALVRFIPRFFFTSSFVVFSFINHIFYQFCLSFIGHSKSSFSTILEINSISLNDVCIHLVVNSFYISSPSLTRLTWLLGTWLWFRIFARNPLGKRIECRLKEC